MRQDRSVFADATRIAVLLLALVLPVLVHAQEAGIHLRVSPAVALPLGADGEYFTLTPGTEIELLLAPKALPRLYGAVGVGYGLGILPLDASLSLIRGGGSLGFRVPVRESLWIEGVGGGGYQYTLFNDGRVPGSGGGFVRGGAGIYLGLSPVFALGLTGEYQNFFGLGHFASVGISAVMGLRRRPQQSIIQPTITAPRPLSEAASAEILQIHDPTLQEVFPVFFKYYNEHPVGSALIRNNTDKEVSGITMNLFVADYMDTPTACEVTSSLAPGESAEVALSAFFNEDVLGIEQSTIKSAQLSLAFVHDGTEYQRTYTQTLRLHDRNSMTWDDFRKPAAYVTPRDASVLSLGSQVSAVVRGSSQSAVHPSLRTAMALHSALYLYGTTYTPDPSSPYRRLETEMAIDYLRFPRQTLAYRAGDCDDLSILYCAVLESLSIPTAMILVPGHIFIAFNLQMEPAEARAQFARAEDLIYHDDETWIPFEITSISDGFLSAWQTGAREWREAVAREQAFFMVTADAWSTFEPVGLPYAEQNLELPTTDAIRAAYDEQVTEFIDQTIYPLVARIQASIADRGRAPVLVNRLAVLYARYGLFDRARRELGALLNEHPDFAPALANMGNIYFQEGDLVEAERSFQLALLHDPGNAGVLLGLARASHALENYGTATRTFDQVKQLDPELADRFAYLDLKGDDAARAAEIGGLAGHAFWLDEEEDE